MVCPHGQEGEGLSQCEHFADKGRGKFFAILCEYLLWTAPNKIETYFQQYMVLHNLNVLLLANRYKKLVEASCSPNAVGVNRKSLCNFRQFKQILRQQKDNNNIMCEHRS